MRCLSHIQNGVIKLSKKRWFSPPYGPLMSEILPFRARARQHEILRNFSKSAHCYHEEALLQQICANRLMAYLQEAQQEIVPGDILEIGCGTGFITEHLFRLFSDRIFCITDASPLMLQACYEGLGGLRPFVDSEFKILDGENFNTSKKYALIVAGLVFQWFEALKNSIDRLMQGLVSGGSLFFSVLESQSFPEWRAYCQELGLPYTGNRLPELSVLCEMPISPLCKKTVWQETVKMAHPSAGHFFKHLKMIGAGTELSQKQLKPHEMKRLIQHWNTQCPEGVTITYHVVYCMYIVP